MSSTFYKESDLKPTHHIHSENEPLPGPERGSATADYSVDALNRIADQDPEQLDVPAAVTEKPLSDSQGGTYPAEIRQDAGRFEGELPPTTSGDTSEGVPVPVNTDNKSTSQGGTPFFEGEAASTKSDDAPKDVSVAVNTDNKLSPNEPPASQGRTYPAETHQGGGLFKGEPSLTASDDAPEDVSVALNTDNKPSPKELPASQGGTYPAETYEGVGRFEGEPAPATSDGTFKDVPTPVTDTDIKPLPRQLPSSQSGIYPTEGEGRFEGEPAPTTTSELPDSAKAASISDKIIGKTEKLVGKITRDSELQTKGAVRASVGKN